MQITNPFDATYLNLVKYVLDNGEERTDRTGVGTISCFSPPQCVYDMGKTPGFPLITTKKVNFDLVARELLWFLSGSHNVNDLGPAKILWDAWAKEDGDLGPVYGAQMRNWKSCNEDGWVDYIDQIATLVTNLKKDPFSRRHCVSHWNVGQLKDMALPPCHAFWQVYVTQSGSLDLTLYQRSADVAVGVVFNVASYSLLLCLLANELGLTPGKFTHTFGDAHIYLNHVDGLKEQLGRNHHNPPTLCLAHLGKPLLKTTIKDFHLAQYYHEPFIKFDVAK
jgi:thymidylate synthase